jgi:hypothetical protein
MRGLCEVGRSDGLRCHGVHTKWFRRSEVNRSGHSQTNRQHGDSESRLKNNTDEGRISILRSGLCKSLNPHIPAGDHDKANSIVAIHTGPLSIGVWVLKTFERTDDEMFAVYTHQFKIICVANCSFINSFIKSTIKQDTAYNGHTGRMHTRPYDTIFYVPRPYPVTFTAWTRYAINWPCNNSS